MSRDIRELIEARRDKHMPWDHDHPDDDHDSLDEEQDPDE